ncbi:MAG: hypothetical protein IJU58_01880 [Clostridia bacterium]|nr:hypothetical protein [Clostridia bacterium]
MSNKLVQMLISQKRFDTQKINSVLAADIYKVLQNYMDIDRTDVKTRLDLDENGCYVLRCKVISKRIKIFGVI